MKRPIFIGGTGRSGTTVLVRILGRHPEIFAVRWESQLLVAPGGLFNVAARSWRRKEVEKFLERLRGRWFHRVLNPGKPNEYTAGLHQDVSDEELEAAIGHLQAELESQHPPRDDARVVRTFIEHLFRPAVHRAGASRWCEKTPRNILFLDRLAQAFPDMRLLHIVRDGRDVVASMLSKGFWPLAAGHEFPALTPFRGEITVEKAARYWVEVLKLADQLASEVDPQHYLEIRFEDLIARPRTIVEQVCSFLGEKVDPRLFEQDLSRHHVGRWESQFAPEEAAAIEEIAGEMLASKGYALSRDKP